VLPIKDNVPTRSFPLVTVSLIIANFVVWIFYELPHLDRSVNQFAFHPCEVNDSCHLVGHGWILTAFTSMFLHASWLHILGNMLFLWIFGNNVEDAMGRIKFAIFYVLSGFAATALQTLVTLEYSPRADSFVPFLGASGAIAGVLGAYALLFPRARVLTLIFIIFFVTLVEIPALILLAAWFILQFVPALGQVAVETGGGEGVAYFAHVGGFAFGLAIAAIMLSVTGRGGREEQPRLRVY
jgi:membrane associated rhomboid family serine protease